MTALREAASFWGVWLLLLVLIVIAALNARHSRRARGPRDPMKYEGRDQPSSLYQKPQIGDRRYSRFFGSYIELVGYEHDNHYHFRVLSGQHRGKVARNQSPWSYLPLKQP